MKCVLLMSPMCLQLQQEPKPPINVNFHSNQFDGILFHVKIHLNVPVLIKIFALHILTFNNRVLALFGTKMDQPFVKVTQETAED